MPPLFYRRERLASSLRQSLAGGTRIVVVHASPGTGKSALLGDFTASLPPGTWCWYELGATDRDPVVFWKRLVERLEGVFSLGQSLAGDLLRTAGRSGIAQAACMLCDDLSGLFVRPLVLVLDNLQFTSDDTTNLEALDALVRFFPEGGQLILCGRSLSAIKLSRYDLRGETLRLGDEELRWRAEELEALAHHDHKELASEEIARILAKTQGWTTGILCLLSSWTQGADVRSEPEILHAYLREEVFAGLSPAFREQLLKCAFLPALNEDTLREVISDSAANFLAELQRHPILIDVQAGGEVRFQELFAEFLQEAFRSQLPEAEQHQVLLVLANRASHLEAIPFLLQAEAWREAELRLIHALPRILRNDQTLSLKHWVLAFPPKWREGSPWLTSLMGDLARAEGDLSDAIEAYLAAQDQAPGAVSRASEEAERFVARLAVPWIHAGLAATYGERGEPDRQLECVTKAMESLDELGTEEWARTGPSGEVFRVISAFVLNVLGMGRLSQHRLRDAAAAFERTLKTYRDLDNSRGCARVLHNLGLVQAEAGEFRRASAYYQESVAIAESTGHLPFPMTFNNLALAQMYLGDLPQAWMAAEKGMAGAERRSARRDRIFLFWTLGALYLQEAQLERAEDFFNRSATEAIALGDRSSEGDAHNGLAEVAIARRNFPLAEHFLARAAIALGEEADGDFEYLRLKATLALEQGSPELAKPWLDALARQDDEADNPFRSWHIERVRLSYSQARGLSERAQLDRIRELEARHGYRVPAASRPKVAAAAAKPLLVVSCLGAFEIWIEGKKIKERYWQTRNGVLVLAYLLLHPDGATKETLAELLFGDQEFVPATFHSVILRLRQALEPDIEKASASRFILFQDGRYLFNHGIHFHFDVSSFRARLAEIGSSSLCALDQANALEDTLKAYRGPFLEAHQDVSWVQIEAENLRRKTNRAIQFVYSLLADVDEWERMESLADRQRELDPPNEAALRAMIVALVMQERPDEARRAAGIAEGLLPDDSQLREPQTAELLELLRSDRLSARKAKAFCAC